MLQNTVGGYEGKFAHIQKVNVALYQLLLKCLLQMISLASCVPCSLTQGEALFLYTEDLEKELQDAKKAVAEQGRSSIPSSRETSHGYVPGRGYLMVHKNTGAYRYSPSTNENTGGVPTSEEIKAFFAERNAGRRALASDTPSEETENQEGGRRRKKHQTRKGRKGTRRR